MKQRFNKEFRATMEIMQNSNHNFVMFDRSFMGLLSIFNALKAELRFHFDGNVIEK